MKNPDFEWSEYNLDVRLYIRHFAGDIPLAFEPCLYQTAKYLNTVNPDKKFSFYLFRKGELSSIACAHFTTDDVNIISPARAPFGGIQCDEKCSSDEIDFLLHIIQNWFSSQTKYALKIKNAPGCYYSNEKNDLLNNAYGLSGFKIADKFINYHIPVSQSPFSEIITKAEIKRLLKCKNAGFRTGLYDVADVEMVYNFIQESRRSKGYLMSMTLDQLNTMIGEFSQECKIFVVMDEHKIIALTVTILVCREVLYNFLPADIPTYKSFSPMVYLTETLYNYCQKEGIKILDLGISLDNNGIEKPGLLKFKKNLGGIESLKFTYEKK